MPSSTLAATIHPQFGAMISISGTGTANSQPASSTGLRPYRSEKAPANQLVIALVIPNATTYVKVNVYRSARRRRSASSGSTVCSWPTIPPTRALTATSSANCGGVRAQAEPERRRRAGGHGPRPQRPAGARPSRRGPRRPPRGPGDRRAPARSRQSSPARRARTSSPPARPAGRGGGSAPSSTWRAPGRCPPAYSLVLPDVDHRRRVDLVRPRAVERGGDRLPGGGPRGHAAGQLAGEVRRSRSCGPARRSRRDPGRRRGRTPAGSRVGHQPAQPGGERRAQRVDSAPGMCPAA